MTAEDLLESMSDVVESIVHEYSVEELLERKYLYEHLDKEYKERYTDFLLGQGIIFDTVDEVEKIVKSTVDNPNQKLKKDLSDLLNHAKEAASVLEVIMIRKKPGGKRPPKKNLFAKKLWAHVGVAS